MATQALMSPLKLALVIRRYPPLIGGAEKVLSYLAEALAREGAEVTVLTSRAAGREGSTSARGSAHPRRSRWRPVDGSPAGNVSITLRGNMALYAEPGQVVRRASGRPGLCLDAQARRLCRGGGRPAAGFFGRAPAGRCRATGDLAWQSWGNFGRKIGNRCKQADAFIAICARHRAS